MNCFSRVTRKTWVVDFETESVQIVGDENGVCLLFVDAERESFDTSKEEERIKGRKGVSDRVDRESDTLQKPKSG